MAGSRLVRAALTSLPLLLTTVPAAAAAAALCVVWRRGLRLPTGAGLAAPTTLLLAATVTVAVAHATTLTSWLVLASVLGTGAVLAGALGVLRREDAADLARGAALVLVVQTVWAVSEVFSGAERASGSLAHPNLLGAVVAMCGVAAFGAVVTRRLEGRLRGVRFTAELFTVTTLTATPLLLSGSRGGLFATTVGISLVLVSVAARSWRPRRGARASTVVAGVVMIVLAVGATLGAAVLLALTAMSDRTQGVLDPEGRVAIWGIATQAIVERPLLGHGFGAWADVGARIEPSFRRERMTSAHNGYLELALTGGTWLLASFLAWVFAIVRAVLRCARDRPGEAATGLGVLGAFLAHSTVESFFPHIALAFLAWIPVAVALAASSDSRDRSGAHLP